MKTRLLTLINVTIMVPLLLALSPLALAAPTGELVMAVEMFGNDIPLPRHEQAHGNDYMNLLYDPFIGTTPDGQLSTEMGVARKWEMTPDGLTWTFNLRKGIRFHDGAELTAKDVKFSVEQLIKPDAKSSNAPQFRTEIKSVELRDPYTLIVHCKKPSIFLPNVMSGLFPCGLVQPKDSYEKVGEDQFIKHPIGSGPYKFHSGLPGSFVKLEATDRHWRDGIPKYKYVTFRLIPEESTRIAMLKTGEADIARISREKVQELEKAGLNVIFKKNDMYVYFWCSMQWTSPLFSDIRFRKALNLAIDKESIMKHIFAGMARPVSTYAGIVISSCGGDPNLKPYPYDPVEARRLIKETGFEGHEITLVSFARPGIPELGRVIETAASYWEKIGLKPKIVPMDYSIFLGRWRTGKTQNMIVGIDGTETPSCPDLVGRLQDKLYSKSGRTMLNDAKIDAMFDKASKSLDPAEVAKLMVDVYQYIYEQYHYIPICGLDGVLATTKRIPKWDPGDRRNERNLRDLIKEQ